MKEIEIRLCNYDSIEDIQMRAESVAQCRRCLDDTCCENKLEGEEILKTKTNENEKSKKLNEAKE